MHLKEARERLVHGMNAKHIKTGKVGLVIKVDSGKDFATGFIPMEVTIECKDGELVTDNILEFK